MKRKIILLIFILFPICTRAQCEIPYIDYIYAQFPTQVLVNSGNYSTGTVLYDTGKLPGSKVYLQNCYYNAYIYFRWDPNYAGTLTSDHIYSTNVAGIGLRVKVWLNSEADGRFVGDSSTHYIGDSQFQIVKGGTFLAPWTTGYYNPQYQLQLVATGGVIPSNSPLTFSGNIAELYVNDDAGSSEIVTSRLSVSASTNIVLTPMGCSANSTGLNFAMGTISSTEFTTSDGVGSAQQTLNLSCEPGTNVTMKVTATPAGGDNPDNTIIALTPGSDTASGVGVKLSLNGAVLPLNTDIALFTSRRTTITNSDADASYSMFTDSANPQGAEGTQDLLFTTQYYKTASKVTGGEANASGTLTFTYN